MPRILGVDIPKEKRIEASLRYIYGIGPTRSCEILAQANIDCNRRAKELSDEEFQKLIGSVTGIPRILIGEPDPSAVSAGMAGCCISRATKTFGELFVLEKIDMSNQMGTQLASSIPSEMLRYEKKPRQV